MKSLSQTASAPPLSVVIPTLGGECLKRTIESLNASSRIPEEILVCIPTEYVGRVTHYSWRNVTVLATDRKGQVAQRAAGFRKARCAFVMQLDDDVLLHERCIEFLIETLCQ